jgi:Ribbon-helix-helix protein, copG family
MVKKRIVIQVDPKQLAALKRRQKETGASVAEIVRRAIAKHLEKDKQ